MACTLAYRQGDKVRVTSGESERVGDTGTIVTVEPERERPYHVIQDNYEFSGWFAASHLKRV